jgi:phenylpyruvate tautomerase PptA (4-oxalocrotonate tautomerase family)
VPIIKIEVCGMGKGDIPGDFAKRAQEAFVNAFDADINYVDVRAIATPWGEFVGHYARGDEPAWVEVIMASLPPMETRKKMVRHFSRRLADILRRNISTIVLHLHEAPRDRMAFGGKLLADIMEK